jgi:hypothetical protein
VACVLLFLHLLLMLLLLMLLLPFLGTQVAPL